MGLIESLIGIPTTSERQTIKVEHANLVDATNRARNELAQLTQSIAKVKCDRDALLLQAEREKTQVRAVRQVIVAREKKLLSDEAKFRATAEHWNAHLTGLYEKGITRIIGIINTTRNKPTDPITAKAISAASANFEYLLDRGRIDIFAHSQAGELRKKLSEEKRQAVADRDYYRAVVEHLYDLIPEIEEVVQMDAFSTGIETPETQRVIPEDQWSRLSHAEKNTIRLNRYLHGERAPWQIGHDYEIFIGQCYEKEGYNVEYYGENKGIHDWGRDLICHHPDGHTLIVQCKCWAHYKEIYERHIFQLFGTTFLYKHQHGRLLNVQPVFVTSTHLSTDARNIAQNLSIQIVENRKLGTYKPIKCNIAQGTLDRIYHLPWDQQYRRTVIDPNRGEFYAATIEEAENCGFRHAMRHTQNGP